MVDLRPRTASGGSSPNDDPKGSIMRLDNLIVEAINNLREPGGSIKTTIAAYIEGLDNLVTEAINNLREPGGSSKTTIAAYVEV
ncbi:hypothetical protein OROHE_024460 [Orobanche hederae]